LSRIQELAELNMMVGILDWKLAQVRDPERLNEGTRLKAAMLDTIAVYDRYEGEVYDWPLIGRLERLLPGLEKDRGTYYDVQMVINLLDEYKQVLYEKTGEEDPRFGAFPEELRDDDVTILVLGDMI
jgi:hypothetical protein